MNLSFINKKVNEEKNRIDFWIFFNSFTQLLEITMKQLKQYENICELERQSLLQKKINVFLLKFNLMEVIVLDMCKIIGFVRADQTNILKIIHNNFYSELVIDTEKERLLEIQRKNADISTKLTNNRNRIIAHLDVSHNKGYFKLKNSKELMEMTDRDEKGNYFPADFYPKEVWSEEKKEQKYSFVDFESDLHIFKDILAELIVITNHRGEIESKKMSNNFRNGIMQL